MTAGYLADKQDAIKTMSPEDYAELLKEAKKQHTQKSKSALDVGTRAHDVCEKIIKSQPYEITEDIQNPVKQFREFEKQHEVKWICTEKIVCHRGDLVAGRLDSLAFVDGKLTLVDLKTSGQISQSYYLQCAGYAHCLADMGIQIDRRVILRLPKEANKPLEAVEVDTPLKDDIRAFIGQRQAYGWFNMVGIKYSEKIKMPWGYETKLKLKKI